MLNTYNEDCNFFHILVKLFEENIIEIYFPVN